MNLKRPAMKAGSDGTGAQIRVIGVGGGGCNAVNRMIAAGISGVEFVAVNTDAQALTLAQAAIRVRIGDKTTIGLGAGGDPSMGAKAAEESQDELLQHIEGADMVFVTAGMGGGTGTGAAPFIAELARQTGALTIAVVTKPFTFEGAPRNRIADEGVKKLGEQVDSLIVIPNDRLLKMADANKKLALEDAFRMADDVLRQGIQGISEVITVPGLINLDFADVRAVMANGGASLMAIGRAKNENRAVQAAEQAIASPLLDVTIDGARGVLFNVTGSRDLTLMEVNEAAQVIRRVVHPDANIMFGAVIDQTMQDEVQVTVIATGFDSMAKQQPVLAATGTDNLRHFPVQRFPPEHLDVPAFIRQHQGLDQKGDGKAHR